MTRYSIALAALSLALASPAQAHSWYHGKTDPVTGGSCCTTSATSQYGDCAVLQVDPGVIEATPDGYRLRLTIEQAQKINPMRLAPVDTFIPYNRIQTSEDGNFHLCIPRYPVANMQADFYCFWQPNFM